MSIDWFCSKCNHPLGSCPAAHAGTLVCPNCTHKNNYKYVWFCSICANVFDDGKANPSITARCPKCGGPAHAVLEKNSPVQAASMVEHPEHYGGDNPYEVRKVLAAWGLTGNANRWNATKYLARAGKKDPAKEIEDLEKAIFYIRDDIRLLKGEKL